MPRLRGPALSESSRPLAGPHRAPRRPRAARLADDLPALRPRHKPGVAHGDAALGAFLKVGYLYGDQGLWGVTATLRAAFLYERSGALDEARQLYARVLANQGPDSDPGRSAAEALRRLEALAGTDTAGQDQ